MGYNQVLQPRGTSGYVMIIARLFAEQECALQPDDMFPLLCRALSEQHADTEGTCPFISCG